MNEFVSDPAHAKFIFWLLSGTLTVIVMLLSIIGYLYREHGKIRDKAEKDQKALRDKAEEERRQLTTERRKAEDERNQEIITTIKESIDNLSTTIKDTASNFESSMKELWGHIGHLYHQTDWLIGQHEVNHKIKGPERRILPK